MIARTVFPQQHVSLETKGIVNAGINGIILLVGADESQRVVSWYASADTHQLVQVAPTSNLDNGDFPNG